MTPAVDLQVLKLLYRALQRVAGIVDRDPTQLGSQLHGGLRGMAARHGSAIESFIMPMLQGVWLEQIGPRHGPPSIHDYWAPGTIESFQVSVAADRLAVVFKTDRAQLEGSVRRQLWLCRFRDGATLAQWALPARFPSEPRWPPGIKARVSDILITPDGRHVGLLYGRAASFPYEDCPSAWGSGVLRVFDSEAPADHPPVTLLMRDTDREIAPTAAGLAMLLSDASIELIDPANGERRQVLSVPPGASSITEDDYGRFLARWQTLSDELSDLTERRPWSVEWRPCLRVSDDGGAMVLASVQCKGMFRIDTRLIHFTYESNDRRWRSSELRWWALDDGDAETDPLASALQYLDRQNGTVTWPAGPKWKQVRFTQGPVSYPHWDGTKHTSTSDVGTFRFKSYGGDKVTLAFHSEDGGYEYWLSIPYPQVRIEDDGEGGGWLVQAHSRRISCIKIDDAWAHLAETEHGVVIDSKQRVNRFGAGFCFELRGGPEKLCDVTGVLQPWPDGRWTNVINDGSAYDNETLAAVEARDPSGRFQALVARNSEGGRYGPENYVAIEELGAGDEETDTGGEDLDAGNAPNLVAEFEGGLSTAPGQAVCFSPGGRIVGISSDEALTTIDLEVRPCESRTVCLPAIAKEHDDKQEKKFHRRWMIPLDTGATYLIFSAPLERAVWFVPPGQGTVEPRYPLPLCQPLDDEVRMGTREPPAYYLQDLAAIDPRHRFALLAICVGDPIDWWGQPAPLWRDSLRGADHLLLLRLDHPRGSLDAQPISPSSLGLRHFGPLAIATVGTACLLAHCVDRCLRIDMIGGGPPRRLTQIELLGTIVDVCWAASCRELCVAEETGRLHFLRLHGVDD